MKKYFFFSLIIISLFFFNSVQAGSSNDVDEVFGIITRATNAFFWFLVAISVIFVLLSAYQFLFSEGEPEKLGKAKKNLVYCVLVIIIGLLARISISVLNNVFGLGL